MRPTRPLTALPVVAVTVLVALTGCAAGLHDETSKERSTPYVAGASVGTIKVRDVVVTVAASSASPSTSASTSPSAAPSTSATPAVSASPTPTPVATGNTGEIQGYLSMVLVNAGTAPDSITALQVAGGAVAPTDPSTSGTVAPGQPVVFGGASTDGQGAPTNQLAISGLPAPLVPGTTVTVTMTFQNAGQLTLQAPVVSAS